MALADICREDLLPVAATLAQEAEVCAAMCKEIGGQWNNECTTLMAFTLSSGIAQILHLQRAVLLETLEAEHAQRVTTAI